MREIKFRAWDGVEMLYPSDAYKDESKADKIAGILLNKLPKPEFMQYTGLRDKNGREVYEGDIVKYPFEDGEVARDVYWDVYEACFQPKVIGIPGEVEVIGNVYENPELTK